jgi:hypothetical protein
MICKILIIKKNDKESIIKYLQNFQDYTIISTDSELSKILNNLKINSKTITEIFPGEEQITNKIHEISVNSLNYYKNKLEQLKIKNFKIFDGIENHLLTEIILFEKAKMILEEKVNTIFIFENQSLTYLAILEFAKSIGYDINPELIKNETDENIIDYIQFDKNHDFNKKRRIRTLSRYLHLIKEKNSSKTAFIIFLNIVKLIIKSKYLSMYKKNSVNEILNGIKKRLKSENKFNFNYALFISSDRYDFLRQYITMLYKFKKREEYCVFTIEEVTNIFFQKENFTTFSLFNEVYLISQIVKEDKEMKEISQNIIQIAKKNNLNLLYLKKLNMSLIDKISESIAIKIISKYILEINKVKAIMIHDGTMYSNAVLEVTKKNKIPSISILSFPILTNPLYRNRYKADKICLDSIISHENMIKLEYPSNRLEITGNPRYDIINKKNESEKKQIMSKYKIPHTKKIILVANSFLNFQNEKNWLAKLTDYCHRNNFFLIIKIHPGFFKDPIISKLINELEYSGNTDFVTIFNEKITPLMIISDIVITDYSNSGMEAITLGKNLLCLNFDKIDRQNRIRYDEMGVALYFEEYNQFEKTLDEILNNNRYCKELKLGREKSIATYNFKNDNMAGHRIFKLFTKDNEI